MKITSLLAGLALAFTAGAASAAETIRIAIGTQDTTINCATGGLLVRELKLLEKYLPRDGRYKDVQYDIQWRNFTSGAPLTNEMVADKLDFGAMADFPGSLNGAAHLKAGKKSIFLSVLSGSTIGSGNGIVVPSGSAVQSVAELKGKQISVPFASTAHGLLLRALNAQGWDVERDVTIVTQAPEVAGSALQANKIDAHANFVPFADLFPYRGFARKIYDGAQSNAATFHGALVNADYAKKYPEIVVAYLRASIEADRLIAAEPEKYSELIAKVTGIEAEVNYLFHGPLGLQTRDLSWKPEYRQALATSIDTLRLLKRHDSDLTADTFIDDQYVRAAFKAAGLDYDAQLKNYDKLALKAKDALTGKAIEDPKRVAQVWVQGEPLVRHYASPENAFADVKKIEAAGKKVRVVFAHDRNLGIKLLANQAWFATDAKGQINAFLLKDAATAWAQANKGKVLDFAAVRGQAATLASAQ
ncbi:Putative nitrate/sulfonate/bicarbonate transporter [Methyloversatilis universalis FAM5]|uniref:Putative aliphatic sulfonates-binding protein n=1 Tax=Methyloversatilis universalis (strain ATCC BAA-1314 / DSM 25237 / JCM 13912 / CCUG 52030 / FAM5) TaxID=1000565 RepID=F5RA07_METUF|nr:ABC transporter substrate-binding protein [Methyloversatilis universalis]EGK72610.1 Putative nitrate/sulfonate/bicarbonate transporter [Methyloversatilis universalis FAM5]